MSNLPWSDSSSSFKLQPLSPNGGNGVVIPSRSQSSPVELTTYKRMNEFFMAHLKIWETKERGERGGDGFSNRAISFWKV